MQNSKRFWRTPLFLLLIAALCGSFAFQVESSSVKAAPRLAPAPGDAVISEFRFVGPQGANDEFIELFNPKNNPVELNGLRIMGSNSSGTIGRRAILDNVILQTGQHYLLVNSGANAGLVAFSRFFRLGPTVFWSLILLAAADYGAARGPFSSGWDLTLFSRHVGHWLGFYRRELRPREAAPALITGHDLMEELHLSPGPLAGRLLRAVRDLQWEGRVSSPEEALREASRLLARWSARERQSGASHSP